MPASAAWHIGTLYHRDTQTAAAAAGAVARRADLVVGDNEPYAVSDATDYTIPVHGEARGLMNTGIEIRQDLIADQAGADAMGGPAGADFREIEATLIKPRASRSLSARNQGHAPDAAQRVAPFRASGALLEPGSTCPLVWVCNPAPAERHEGCRTASGTRDRAHRALVSASQMPPPIMKPPEMRDNSRVRRAEKNSRARPASSA